MAIGARIYPELLVHGTIQSVKKSEWEGEYRGRNVTIVTEGGPLVLRVGTSDDHQVFAAGTQVALVASVYDGQRGASLSFERWIDENELDKLASILGAVAVGAK